MITNKELNTVKLSPTKKDFYQIWNELLDTSRKISERWDPASTNESDPGIVLLKVLTAVADKLNYNIDANTLEAFMPSAAQEDSMRKLTEMLGYNMKYYQSATTEVKISYTKNVSNPIPTTLNTGGFIVIDKFTNIKDIDDSINYITLNSLNLTKDNPAGNVPCIEGELVECETDDNNVVSMFHLDDNYRYFLPETQVAENGIFITNIISSIEGEEWTKVDNLNSQALGSKVFKFGFDSFEGLPYVQFPDDISTIIEDGLKIKYVRTTGLAGNISAGTLTKLTTPISWSTNTTEEKPLYYDINNYTVSNIRAATNGANKEGINSAYNNFKKTIGTFDTLVTCRDYMNRIYQMLSDTDNTTPLVSNVIVSDIRDDINRAVTLGTFTHRGIEYKAIAKPYTDTEGTTKTKLTHFDLMLYPFTPVYGLNSKAEFIKSFKYNSINIPEILAELENNKTISHNIISPESDEIVCIKNYYKLRAKVNTIRKVGSIEQANILSNIYIKLFENFNMRKMDFGEEIPYDVLLQVMETADPRIKNISLDEPELTFKICTADTQEYELSRDMPGKAAQLYNQLVLNNVLAGRVPLFNYNESFKPEYNEAAYPSWEEGGITKSYAPTYPVSTESTDENSGIYKLKTTFDIPVGAVNGADNLKLMENEVIQFRAPNLKTTITYPAYVYYYLHLEVKEQRQAIPVTMQSLADFLRGGPESDTEDAKTALNYYANTTNCPITKLEIAADLRAKEEDFKNKFKEIESASVAIFTKNSDGNYVKETVDSAWEQVKSDNTIEFYTFIFDKDPSNPDELPRISDWRIWLLGLDEILYDSADKDKGETDFNTTPELKGLYSQVTPDFTKAYGYLTEIDGTKYKLVETAKAITANPFEYYFIPRIWYKDKTNTTSSTTVAAADWHTKNGLGQDAIYGSLTKDCEYKLKPDEYLLIYYKKSAESDSEQKIAVSEVHDSGTIIKPNFDLIDSEDWKNSGHNWTTSTGYSFTAKGINDPKGMFALGTNEQIEIREIVKVKLDTGLTNLYWEVNNEKTETDGKLVLFPWEEEPIYYTDNTYKTQTTEETEFKKCMAYTLKEGEYLYYTDMNKTDIAFYGSGTTIRRTTTTPTIFKYITDDAISTDEISDAGLNAAIPWRGYNFTKDNGLTLMENQYINLTKGDSLCTINMKEAGTETITSDYKPVENATYKLANSGEDLILSLPDLQLGDNYNWQVRSKLELDMSSTKSQTLHCYELNGNTIKDKLTLINSEKNASSGSWVDSDIITLEASDTDNPLSIKSNKAIQSSSIVTDVATYIKSEEGITEEIKADLTLKLFKDSKLTFNSTNSYVNLNNFGDGTFTAINFEEIKNNLPPTTNGSETTNEVSTALNVLLPDDSFGLMMLYYEDLREDKTGEIKTPATTTSTKEILSNFNSFNSESNSINLVPGINIIKIAESDTITINSGSNTKASIIFSSLDIIYKEDITNNKTSLNPKLCYKAISKDTPYEQILEDIKAIDINNEFYYNMPIAGNLDIDMNLNDTKDTLENPLNWFNYNNINNKFVIAEIDANTLIDGITIAKSSRSNY